MDNKHTEEIIEILDNIIYWDSCPIDYKEKIPMLISELKAIKNNSPLPSIIKSYTEQNMDDAYDKGYNDGSSEAATDIMNSL